MNCSETRLSSHAKRMHCLIRFATLLLVVLSPGIAFGQKYVGRVVHVIGRRVGDDPPELFLKVRVDSDESKWTTFISGDMGFKKPGVNNAWKTSKDAYLFNDNLYIELWRKSPTKFIGSVGVNASTPETDAYRRIISRDGLEYLVDIEKKNILRFPDAKRWMSNISNNKQLCRLTLPGTHDAGARMGPETARCQDLTIAAQLNQGIRALDIRVRAMSDDTMDIYHDRHPMDLKLSSVIKDCKTFLTTNPTECIVMMVKREQTKEDGAKSVEELLNAMVDDDPSLFFKPGNVRIPTLRLGAARGKIILIENKLNWASLSPGYWKPFDNEAKKPNGTDAWVLEGVGATGIPAFVDLKWSRLVDSKNTGRFRAVFISGTGVGRGGFYPSTISAYMNDAIFKKLSTRPVAPYKMVFMDFPPAKLTRKLFESNTE